MKTSDTQQKNGKKIFLIVLIATLLVAVGGYFAYAAVSQQVWPFTSSSNTQTTDDDTNYAPPTEQEIRDSQDGKKNSGEQENQTPPANVSVGISFAGYDDGEGVIDIRAFTTDVIEGDGTCRATLTLNGQEVTRESKAFVDSSSSQCEPIQISLADFPAGGTWKLVVDYQSGSHSGSSSTVEVEVNK